MKTNNIFKIVLLLLSLSTFVLCSSQDTDNVGVDMSKKEHKINIIIGDSIITASIIDSPTGRDFIAQLPLDVDFEDYASTEKVTYLPNKLTTDSAPKGYQASTGDITYYSPWGNIAIFYKNFSYANGLINLGKIDSNLHLLTKNKEFKARIELAK